MPNETLITEIENLLSELVRLGGENERTSIVPNLTVVNASPGIAGFVIISDNRDGDNILAKTVPGVIYNNNDLVNVMFIRGGEAIAFQQGSQSPSSGLWSIVPSTSTDIYYNAGDVGIGKAVAPDARLELLDTAQAQLRLTHTEDTKFVNFTLDTNHDLTIKPSSTGQIKLQPTTNSVDFFQVLNAAGTPITNVDSTNSRFGIGTATPGFPLDVAVATGPQIQLGDGTGNAVINLNGTVTSRDFRFQTTGVNRWIFRVNGTLETGSNAGSDFEISRRADDGSLLSTAFILVRSNNYMGINVASPQGLLHGYSTISGFEHWEYDGLDGTSRTIIPNGAGDVLYNLTGRYNLRDSSGNVADGAISVANGGSQGLAVGGNTVTIAVAATGATTISRTAGADTIKVGLWLLWL